MTDATDASDSTLARELLAAARAEPGRPDAGVGAALARSGATASASAEIIEAVQESQLLNARLRRRATELEALFSTARELVRLQDVDEVLGRLVERAHALMGTDVTYLSQIGPGDDLIHVRHSTGTVTPEFRDLEVPAGIGLASRVVTTREPAWVARYEALGDVPRDDRIDAAVEAEGLVSFLGVPLAVGDEVLGALFACNRFAHDYSPEEVLLLSAFADHAAAVLRTARALADRAAATASAEAAYRELQTHLAATELASAVHEQLTAAAMSGGSVVDLVATVSERLGRRVQALDEQGRPLDDGGVLPQRAVVLAAMARSQSSGQAESIAVGERRWSLAAILGADRVLGAILAEDLDDAPALAGDAARRTLERAAQVAALVSLKQDAARSLRAERRARWLLEEIDGAHGIRPGDEQPFTPSRPVIRCAVLDLRSQDPARAAAALVDLVGDNGIVARREQAVVVAWTTDVDADGLVAATERLRRTLSDRLREPAVTAVLGRSVDVADAIGESVRRATADLAFLRPLGIEGVTIASASLSPYHALSAGDPDAVVRFVDEILGPLLDWDERRGTELLTTIGAYFDAGESRQLVAERLHLHRNTVQQRLDRARVLLDGSWEDPEYRFRVQAAVRLERLRRDLRASAARPDGARG